MIGHAPDTFPVVPYEGTRRSQPSYTVHTPNTTVKYDCESYFLILYPPKVEAWKNVTACSHQSSPVIFPQSQNTQYVVVLSRVFSWRSEGKNIMCLSRPRLETSQCLGRCLGRCFDRFHLCVSFKMHQLPLNPVPSQSPLVLFVSCLLSCFVSNSCKRPLLPNELIYITKTHAKLMFLGLRSVKYRW